MKLRIKVHSNSSQEKIKKVGEGKYEIWIKKSPVDGKANSELIKFLKEYLKKRKIKFEKIKIKKGLTSRNKIIEIS